MHKEIMIPVLNLKILLEAEIFFPDNEEKQKIALLCHPHPQFGGNLHNNVISALFNHFYKSNIPVLRFNFRGIGKSSGTYGRDEGEQEDVRTCVKYLIENEGFKKVIIMGYSYGAAIGCSQINYLENIIGYVAIAFPFDLFIKFKKQSQSSKPKLFIQGDKDIIASFSSFFQHFGEIKPPKEYKIIKDADHFFWGGENQAAKFALDFIESL